jgi:hypothetical protein
MRIDTVIHGNPTSVQTAGDWLRSTLSSGMRDAATTTYRARTLAEAGWQGGAGAAFGARMTTVGRGADLLADGTGALGRGLQDYADTLRAAQDGMHRARRMAAQGGLTVTPTGIAHPGGDPIKIRHWELARDEALHARRLLHQGELLIRRIVKEISVNPYLTAAEFVNDVAETAIKRHASKLAKRADELADFGRGAVRSHRVGGGVFRSVSAAIDQNRALAGTLCRIGGKLPLVGYGIEAVGIGLDIHGGEPPAKAIVTGVVGAAVGTYVGTAVTALGGPFAWAGIPVGIGAGIVAEGAAGVLYDEAGAALDKVGEKLAEPAGKALATALDKADDAKDAIVGGLKTIGGVFS